MYLQNATLSGLSTFDYSVPETGACFIEGKIQLPRLASGGTQSSVVATITNETTSETIQTTVAGSDGFYVDTFATLGDVLRVALTSADPADAVPNAVKCEISLGSGQ